MKRALLLLFTMFVTLNLAIGQFLNVSGAVADSSYSPIPEVNIFITNGSIVGKTDVLGKFFFELRSGEYELVFSHPNYQQVRVKVVLNHKNDTVNVILPPLQKQINEVNITAKYKDPGPEMMRKAIVKRDFWGSKFPSNSCHIYIRAFEEYEKPKTVKNVWHSDSNNTKAKKAKDEISGNMAEINMVRDFMPPYKIKETKDGVSIRGDKDGLFYLSTTEGDFNFYQNLVRINSLSEMPVLSPLANTALLSYKFHFLGSYKDELGRRILKIKMEPRLVSNSVFSGEIHLVDSLFYIYRINVQFPKNQLNEYNQFNAAIEYNLHADTSLTVQSQRFDYFAKAGKGKFTGYTFASYSQYELHKTFPKNYFGLEVGSSADSAYDRDSLYWEKKRTLPLNTAELKFINRSDSIKRVLNSDVYLDSMEKVTNKITFKKIVLKGQDYQNRKKGLNLGFQPLWLTVQPFWPGGTRIVLWNTLQKTYPNKKEINFVENLSYGINNKNIQGSLVFSTLYNPYKRSLIYLTVGRSFNLINSNSALLDIVRRNNYYLHNHITLYHSHEVVNGLFLRVQGEFSDRQDLSRLKFDKFADSFVENNTPSSFKSHRALFASINLSYTPFQKYIREPKQKVILGSRWPTFTMTLSKAVPGVFGTTIDYTKLEFGIDYTANLGLMGRSELRMISGSFLSRKNLSIIDYRYHRRGGGDLLIFVPPMLGYQTLDSTFQTFKRFYEVHYRHQFNGAIINKIPGFKMLKIRESVGTSILYAPERRNMLFYEVYGGIDKMVRFWREKAKIGIYYCVGFSNIYQKPIYGFRINVEFFDRRDNSW